MKKWMCVVLVLVLVGPSEDAVGQAGFSSDPLRVEFVTSDHDHFWEAFDRVGAAEGNPFEEYLNGASVGLKPFVEYLGAEALLQAVQTRQADYLKSRYVLMGLEAQRKRVRASYAAMKYWYPKATFPPVYFIVGRFTSGGTASENGLIVGTELMDDLDGLVGLIAHELIHYQQQLPGKNTLLEKSIMEGSADFIGELISGEHINPVPFHYGEENEGRLCREFVSVMMTESYTDWLYGTSGKDDRPNDLGYWIGYKITEAFFEKQNDKKAAIYQILNFNDPLDFLKQSGYLARYHELNR